MSFFKWSKVAATDASADPSCPWPEGMAPSQVNDSARGMMAAAAKFRDDISGAIVTGGTLNAYTVASNQGFTALATDLNGQLIAFTPHATNGDTVTLNVDGLGAKPLRSAPGVELVAGTLVLGTPYIARYNHSDTTFYLSGYYSSPFNLPFLGGCDYWDTIAPNSAFIFPAGQAISRTVYSRAFARWGTTFGIGDGATTFNVPDKRGRVSAMLEGAASRLTATFFGGNSTVLGAVGGLESQTLTLGQLPTGIASNADNSITLHSTEPVLKGATNNAVTNSGSAFAFNAVQTPTTLVVTDVVPIAVVSNNTSGQAHRTVQPTICCNYILRII